MNGPKGRHGIDLWYVSVSEIRYCSSGAKGNLRLATGAVSAGWSVG